MRTKLTYVFDTNNIKGLSFTRIFDRIKSYRMSVYQEKMCESVKKKKSRLANYKEFDSVLEIVETMYVNSYKNGSNRSIIAKFRSSTFS